MAKVIKLEGFYVEVSDPVVTATRRERAARSGIQRTGGLTTAAEKLGDARETIVSVCRYVKGAFEEANHPDELKVKFGIKLGGELGIPYVTKGTGEATIEVEATWGKAKA